MGTDKALLPIDSVSMLERTVGTLRAVVNPVCVVGGGHDGAGVAYVEDHYPGEGPLGGVLTALRESATEALVVVSCDLPGLGADTLRVLLDALRDSGADYAVPIVQGRRQWHCMAFHGRCRAMLDRTFADGARSYRDGLVGLSECALLFARSEAFMDIDTPEQYEEVAGAPRLEE